MSDPDFSGLKEIQQNAWKIVFDRLDKLEKDNHNLRERIDRLEQGAGN